MGSQKVEVGLVMAVEVQEVKADLLMKDRSVSTFKLSEKTTPYVL